MGSAGWGTTHKILLILPYAGHTQPTIATERANLILTPPPPYKGAVLTNLQNR